MMRRITLEKQRGETPLEALTAWRHAHPAYTSTPASYAGRLDPMASGKLLILLGDECKKQEQYTKLDKEYEIEVLLDLSTDTGDVLGLASYAGTEVHSGDIQAALRSMTGSHEVPYPAYSSKTVNGKPLFLHTLEGSAVDIPTHTETVYRIRMIERTEMQREKLAARIQDLLSVVPRSDEPSKHLGADFRQDAIRERWTEVFSDMPDRRFTLYRLRVTCASGTYMRTLAERIGRVCGTTALALSIHRTRIGRYLPLLGWVRSY